MENGHRVGRFCAGLVAVGALALAVAGPGSARGTGGVTITYDQGFALMKGTHGYKVQIFGTPGELRSPGTPGRVQVSAFKGQRALLKGGKGPKPTVSSGYTATGTVGPTVMKADLGKFGKVDLEFHAQKTTHPTPAGCHGALTLKKGVWKGTFRFKGEHGYTKASATHIDGQYESGSTTCNGASGGGGKTYVILSASTVQPKANGYATFEASKRKSGGKPAINASSSESKGAVDIYRNASMTGDFGDFTYNDPAYTQAKVKGSGPFSGTGHFHNGDWTGSLTVKYPGETVGLTSGFVAHLGEETFKAPRLTR